MKFTQIKETCLYVKNLKNTREFYAGKLGLETIAFAEGRHVFFRAGASVLLCFDPEATRNEEELPAHYATGEMHLAFEVERADYEATRRAVTDAGIPIEHDHDWQGGYRSFYFRDPDNHVLEVVEKGMWG